MKSQTYEDRDAWLLARKGKITGSRVKDLIVKRGTGKKKGFYELIAERIAIPAGDENPMDRGNRLEKEAIVRFEQETGLKVDTSLVLWSRDDEESIAISPDGFIGEYNAVEVKCLSSASHIEAYLTKEIPSEYQDQAIQYFVVNDKLETLYSVFYDPRIPCKDYFVIITTRESLGTKIDEYREYQIGVINEVDQIVNDLVGF